MIIKGKSRAGAGSLAHHLGNAEKNERVELFETRGTIADDLRGALVEMEAYACGTRCEKSLYHAAISPEPPHRLTPDQRSEAIDALEKKMGLEGHARIAVLHEKEGREHLHVVWSRIDVEQMRSVSDSHNYRKHEEVARDLERRFGHERVQGAHIERKGPDRDVPRPDRTPSRAELRQEERTGVKGRDVKAEISGAFQSSDNAGSFKAALEDRGYILAQGDRRDFVIVDSAGGVHSLARRIDGVKAAELREFMAPIDRESLPSADEAQALAKLRDHVRREAGQQSDQADREKAYGRGEGYVSQSQAALQEHKDRQAALNEAFEARDANAAQGLEKAEKARSSLAGEDEPLPETTHMVPDNVEMTDRVLRLLEQLNDYKGANPSRAPGDGRGPQGKAPGSGGSRSR